MKRTAQQEKTSRITIATGSTGLVALTDPAITNSDVLVSFDARAEQDAIGLPPNVIRVPIGDDHTKDSLLATMATQGVKGIEAIIKLLRYASGNLAEGLQGYGLMGYLYAMYLLTTPIWSDFVSTFTDTVYQNCKGSTTIKVRFISSLSGGTGSGILVVIAREIERILHQAYPTITIDIEFLIVGPETYRGLRPQTHHNHAFHWVDLINYVLAIDGKDDKVTRKMMILELKTKGTDKAARRNELRMILPAILSDSFDEVAFLSSNHTTFLDPYGRIILVQFGWRSGSRMVEPLQFALAHAAEVLGSTKNGEAASLPVSVSLNLGVSSPARHEEFIAHLRQKGSKRPVKLADFLIPEFEEKDKVTMVTLDGDEVSLVDFVAVTSTVSMASYVAHLASLQGALNTLHEMETATTTEIQHTAELAQAELDELETELEKIWPQDEPGLLEKSIRGLKMPGRDETAMKVKPILARHVGRVFEEADAKSRLGMIQAAIVTIGNAIAGMNQAQNGGMLDWIVEMRDPKAKTSGNPYLFKKTDEWFPKALEAFKAGDKARFRNAILASVEFVTKACLCETLGLATTSSVADIVAAIDQDPPEDTISDAPNRRDLNPAHTLTHKIIPRVDDALLALLQAEVNQKGFKLSLFRTGAVVQPVVATVDFMFAGYFADAIPPQIVTDYEQGAKWWLVCSHPGIADLVQMRKFDEELQALVKAQEQEAHRASGLAPAAITETKEGVQ